MQVLRHYSPKICFFKIVIWNTINCIHCNYSHTISSHPLLMHDNIPIHDIRLFATLVSFMLCTIIFNHYHLHGCAFGTVNWRLVSSWIGESLFSDIYQLRTFFITLFPIIHLFNSFYPVSQNVLWVLEWEVV